MIKFPYMNMQQLNLDWIMERIGNTPEIVHVPALAGDQYSDLLDLIDMRALEIPNGFSIMQAGKPEDNIMRQCVAFILKYDNDNISGFAMGFSGDIFLQGLKKEAGVWQ